MLHLVRPDNHAPSMQGVELLLRVVGSGVTLCRILLEIPGLGDIPSSMSLSHANPERAADATRPSEPVAGRIDAQPTPLCAALEAWLAHRAAKGLKPRGVAAYRQTLEAAIRRTGWTAVEDLSFENITAYLDEARRALGWKGASYNRALTVFRAFTRHAARRKLIAEDPLTDVDRAVDDEGDGSRAATVEEARRLIAHAWHRQNADQRSKGNRALYWLCLFAAGTRAAEPEQWRWKHLLLDEPVPLIRWLPAIQKNGKTQECPLAPELVALLRRHREAMRELARTTPAFNRSSEYAGAKLRLVDPSNPEAFVFPIVPPRHTFRSDRAKAGIAELDSRGRRFSPHSARKFFSTVLTVAGVSSGLVDRLMRHAGTVESRYVDPSLGEMARALAHMPRLWPEALDLDPTPLPSGEHRAIVDNFWTGPVDLTTAVGCAHHQHANPASPSVNIEISSSRRALVGFASLSGPAWARIEDACEQVSAIGAGPRPEEFTNLLSGNAEFRTANSGPNLRIAALLRAIADLLQHGADGHDGPSQQRRPAS